MINVGVIGIGYWGPNIVRNFVSNFDTTVVACADLRKERLDFIASRYPSMKTTKDFREIINNPSIDAVSICTPVSTHYEIAKSAIQAGKHIMLAKPMTYTSAQGEDLLNLSEQKNTVLIVDHTFLFTGAVKKIKEIVDRGEIGNIYYFDSVRVNLGLFQHDVNVIWDLAPHDISIMDSIINAPAEAVVATGADHLGSGLEDVAYLTVYYSDNIIAHIHVNWISPVKVRHTLIGGTKKMIVWDDNVPSEKVRVYDKGINVVESADDVYKTLIEYRTGDMYCPKVSQTEALLVEVEHFTECIQNGSKPKISDGHLGLQVVRILEASQRSIKNRGKEIRLS